MSPYGFKLLGLFGSTGGGVKIPEDDGEGDEDVEPTEWVHCLRDGHDRAGRQTKWIYPIREEDCNGDIKSRKLQPFAKGVGIREEKNNRDDGKHLTESDEWPTESIQIRRVAESYSTRFCMPAHIRNYASQKPNSTEILPSEIHTSGNQENIYVIDPDFHSIRENPLMKRFSTLPNQ